LMKHWLRTNDFHTVTVTKSNSLLAPTEINLPFNVKRKIYYQ